MMRYLPYALGVLLLGALFALHNLAISSADKAGYKRATREMEVEIYKANAKNRTDEQAAQRRANEVDHDHQKTIAILDARYAAVRVPVVRLCPPAARPVRVPAATAAAGGTPDTPDANQLPGRDIGPDLFRIARQADDQTQRLIACQRFITP